MILEYATKKYLEEKKKISWDVCFLFLRSNQDRQYSRLVIFQPATRMEVKTSMSMVKSIMMEQTIPSLDTGTGSWKNSVYSAQGKGSLEEAE